VLSPVYLREAGLLLENEKKNEEALELYEQIKSEYPSSTLVSTQVGPNGLTSQIDQDITRVSK
jgi:TolA-binding protein